MAKSLNSEYIGRINTALLMMRKYSSTEVVVAALMKQYGVSRRQSYRYIQEAQKTKHKLQIPEEKTVFTVKLPISLVSCIREHANSTGESISAIVTQALKAFLKRRGHGREV